MGLRSTSAAALLPRAGKVLGRWLKGALLALGGLTAVAGGLAFTRVPYDLHRWLGTAGGRCPAAPEVLVVLGGSGMPSGPELLRLHYAAAAAVHHHQARLLLVHPHDTAVMRAMVAELVLRGVDAGRIDTLMRGTNTREQALAVGAFLGPRSAAPMALITAPENMYRSLGAFRRAGLSGVGGLPAFDHAMFADLGYRHGRIGGKDWVPDVSGEMGLRYNFWNYLKLEVTCAREYAAIGYYWLNDWI